MLKNHIKKVASSLLICGTLMGTVSIGALAQGRWNRGDQNRQARRAERFDRRAEQLNRRLERLEMQRIRQLDRQRRLRYQNWNENRLVGYYDRFGQFHAVGYYDRAGNFWRYR